MATCRGCGRDRATYCDGCANPDEAPTVMRPDDVRAIVEACAKVADGEALAAETERDRLDFRDGAIYAATGIAARIRAIDPASLMGAGDGEAEALREAVHLLGRVAATARGSLLLLARSAQLRATPSLINEAEGAAESLERALARLDAAKGGQ